MSKDILKVGFYSRHARYITEQKLFIFHFKLKLFMIKNFKDIV